MDKNNINVDKLRKKLYEESLGAGFVGGFGGGFVEAERIKKASDEEIIQMAQKKGYRVDKKLH